MFSVRFTPIVIVDIVLLPPGEKFDRYFFVDILGSLKKKFAQIPYPNPEKGRFSHLENTRLYLADFEIQTRTSPNCPIQLTAQIWPRPTSGLLDI
jgi:hypothetical protein